MALRLTRKAKETILNRVNEDYEFGLAERDRHVTDWKTARKLYYSQWTELSKAQDDEDLDQWFFVPKTDMVISRILCAINDHFFPRGRMKLAKVTAPDTAGMAVQLAAQVADTVLHAVLDREAMPHEVLPFQWEAALVEGNGWVKMGWDRFTDSFMLEYLPNEHVVFDPYALLDKDIRWVIHERWMTEDELWKRQRAGIYDNVKDVVGPTNQAGEDEWRRSVTGPGNSQRFLYKILEFWGPVQPKGDESLDKLRRKGKYSDEVDMVVTVYGDNVLLRAERNPYADFNDSPTPFSKLPFSKCAALPRRGYPDEGSPCYDLSLVLRMKPIQLEVNTIRNQRRQAVEAEMTGKVFYDQNRLTDLEALYRAKYMGPVGTNGSPRDAVMYFSPQTSTQGMEREEQIVDADLRDLTGVTHYHLGSTVAGMQKTATGTSLVTSEGNVKMERIIQNIANTSVKRIAEFALDCCLRFVPHRKIESIMSGEMDPNKLFILLGDGDRGGLLRILEKDYHVELEAGASATSKQNELQKIHLALQASVGLAQIDPEFTVPVVRKLQKRMLKLLGLGDVAVDENSTPITPLRPPARPTPEGNAEFEMEMMQQGRIPTPEETRIRR